MRSNPSDYEMLAPGNLIKVVSLLTKEPGVWLPIAGGTDVMVQYAAGRLPARKLVSIWNLPELRRIDVTESEISIGAGCTYTDLRKHEIVGREFPLLHSAARWTGGVANQNRGTIGGNIVNASPAADSLPALLAYDAELVLVSVRGERRVRYTGFHTGYKKTLLAIDELVQSVCLPRRFAGYFSHARKVGARNSQAISKVCIAALGRIAKGVVENVHIALGSVTPVPLRMTRTEQTVRGRTIDADLLRSVRKAVSSEIQPIDDIRSTARYRVAVAGNLVAQFLLRLNSEGAGIERVMNPILERWNRLSIGDAMQDILPCCGSRAWAQGMVARRPLAGESALLAASDEIWRSLAAADWMEAFNSHPRIGESRPSSAPAVSVEWSAQEQSKVEDADTRVKDALADANREYERRFNRIFIVCATGKSADEILKILQRRLTNDADTELHEAAEQQRQITQLRLKKWLQG
ncbi:MAG TPA: 2-oxo-4-hydroxy-4-carboxy-5-ureidoimidazoline decarboxylase [Candidatus Sulfotelmatobacter sp.]|nr:2-oxo-4-hydroxy-4-carboxy-5-ureidoimidazoline decarboxylase [Candidatus Sulfotelmatobacter sp.]